MPHINPGSVMWNTNEGIVTALKVGNGTFLQFNSVGSSIWRLIAEGRNEETIVDVLAVTYDASREKISKDVKVFINKMLENGMLEA